jgi:hypothetical protein
MKEPPPPNDAGAAQSQIGDQYKQTTYIADDDADASLLAIAIDYAALGFSVFPCLEKTKEPAVSRGFYNATTNPAVIRRWFGNTSHHYNIAIRTGIISGVAVFDIDGPNGAAAAAELEAKFSPLPRTLTSITSAGCHLYFRISEPLQSSLSRVGPCLDIKACGGYVMAPGSTHPDGWIYRWGSNAPIAPIPEWLATLARKPPPKPAPVPRKVSEIAVSMIRPPSPIGHNSRSGVYGRGALEDELHILATTLDGQRNHALNRASFNLHQLVDLGELDEREVYRGLWDATIANGLMDDRENGGPVKIAATIASGRRGASEKPRRPRR